ncbi:MAG: hypothetical protein V4655_08800 [Bdellovibrionota bacterium]
MRYRLANIAQLGLALGVVLAAHVFATDGAWAEPAVIRYTDEAAGFIVIDQAPGDWKDGDQVCLFDSKDGFSSCEVTFRWHTRQALLFPGKTYFERFEVGQAIDVRKIYLGNRDTESPLDVMTYKNEIKAASDHKLSQTKTTDNLKRQKFAKGMAPEVTVEVPTIEGDEFPEILIPKLHKQKIKRDRDTSDIALIRKGLKRTLKNRDQVKYQFASLGAPEEVLPPVIRDDYPNPLNGALKLSVYSATPLFPMSAFDTLRFKTITNQTVNRNSLWNQSKTKLEADQGYGLNLQITSRMKSFVNVGWRYHNYNALDSRSTFDEFDVSLIALNKTRVNEQIIYADWGQVQNWTDWYYTSWAFGSDLAYTDVNFDSRVDKTDSGASFILANARQSFLTIAPRVVLSTGVERYGFGFNLGMALQIPIYDFKKSFKGEVTVPERVRFQGSAVDDLKNSLTGKRNAFGAEIFIGISYQPQRKSR